MILRKVATVEPTPLISNAELTADDLNLLSRRTYLQQVDAEFYRDQVSIQYASHHLNPTGEIAAGDIIVPILSTPSVGDAPRVWAKDSTGAMIDYAVDPGGKTAAQLEIELAEATVTTSGSAMIGYHDTVAPTTVKAALDKVALPATSNQANGAANISAWNLYQNADYAPNTPQHVQNMIDVLSETIKSATAAGGGSEFVPHWWTYVGISGLPTSSPTTVGNLLQEIFKYPIALTGTPVTYYIYAIVNMSGTKATKSIQLLFELLLNSSTVSGATAYLWHKWDNGLPGEIRVRSLLDSLAPACLIAYGDYVAGWNSLSSVNNTQIHKIYCDSNASIGKVGSAAKYKTANRDVVVNLVDHYSGKHNNATITGTQAGALYDIGEALYIANTGAAMHLTVPLTLGPITMKF